MIRVPLEKRPADLDDEEWAFWKGKRDIVLRSVKRQSIAIGTLVALVSATLKDPGWLGHEKFWSHALLALALAGLMSLLAFYLLASTEMKVRRDALIEARRLRNAILADVD